MTEIIRDGGAILDDLHILTTRMVEQRHDADFLIDGIERRQTLIDEYEDWAEVHPQEREGYERTDKAKKLVEKILGMDQIISKTLSEFKAAAQQSVQSANTQQKVISYLNGSISSSGSYMDVKK
jgi:hypothetical protein